MKITLDLPEDIAESPDPGKLVLEALAIAGYRSEALTQYQMRRILGLTRMEVDGFFKSRGIMDHAYDVQDLENELRTLEGFSARPSAAQDLRSRPIESESATLIRAAEPSKKT